MTIEFMELELTRSCDLECVHCYNESGPLVGHGPMMGPDWIDAIDQGVALGMQRVQLIGGEPTRHPDFPAILNHAVAEGLSVSVFTNLTHIKDEWWPLLGRPGVTISTSYYSDVAAQHDRVTTRTGSHAKTRANIIKAIGRGIQVKAAVTTVFPGQRVKECVAELKALGVEKVAVDGVREVGRGGGSCDVNELCGLCGFARVAILPDGVVTPCVLGRWLKTGNIRVTTLAEILAGDAWQRTVQRIPRKPRPSCLPQAEQMQTEREKVHAHL
jgi:MoaA/NifB/PqqE/SkfB family radical SAM enzyme